MNYVILTCHINSEKIKSNLKQKEILKAIKNF